MAKKQIEKKGGSGKVWALLLIIGGLYWGISSFVHWVGSLGRPSDTSITATDEATEVVSFASAEHAGSSSWPPLDANNPPPAADLTASNYYIVLDGSGSMGQSECARGSSKMRVALTALSRFVGNVPPEANLGLAVFDLHDLSERVPLATGNRERFSAALKRVGAHGGTPLRSAIELGFEKLTEQARRQLGYGEYHLVIVTDGNATPDDEDPTDIVRSILDVSPVVVHTIGFCIGTDHVLNQPGRTLYMAADSPAELDQGLAQVLAEAPSFDAASFETQAP